MGLRVHLCGPRPREAKIEAPLADDIAQMNDDEFKALIMHDMSTAEMRRWFCEANGLDYDALGFGD